MSEHTLVGGGMVVIGPSRVPASPRQRQATRGAHSQAIHGARGGVPGGLRVRVGRPSIMSASPTAVANRKVSARRLQDQTTAMLLGPAESRQ